VPINVLPLDKLVDLKHYRGLVVIPTYNSTPTLPDLIEILDETLPDDFGIVIIDDNSPKFNELLGDISVVGGRSRNSINVLKQESNLGFVKNMNTVFKNISGLDIILCNSDAVPARNWFPGLLAAAKSSNLVATATAVTNYGSVATVEFPELDMDFLTALNLLGDSSPTARKVFPILPTCVGHFVYFNAAALETVGYFDEIFSPGYGEEVDWSQRAIASGFRHVLAPESVVFHKGSFSFSEKLGSEYIGLKDRNNSLVLDRYSNFSNLVETICAKDRSLIESTRMNFRRISNKLSLRIDLTYLRPSERGTATTRLSLEISSRLMLRQDFEKIEFVISDDMDFDHFSSYLSEDAKIIQIGQLNDLPRSDFVFRPMQIHTKSDLVKLNNMGKRQIVFQLDFIAYENPYYFENPQQWNSYRPATELAHQLIDGFTYLSDFVKEQSSLIGLAASPDFAREVIFPHIDHKSGKLSDLEPGEARSLDDLKYPTRMTLIYGATSADKTATVATSIFNDRKKSDQLLNEILEQAGSFNWDDVVSKLIAFIGNLASNPPVTSKDVLWELLLRDYENEIRDNNEKLHLLAIERQAEEALRLHNLRLDESILFRIRHSKFGNLIIPKGSWRDHILQKLF